MAILTRDQTLNLTFQVAVTPNASGGNNWDRDAMQVVLLMDIRDELQKLNALLHCQNFVGIPRTLKTIARKIPTRKKGVGR